MFTRGFYENDAGLARHGLVPAMVFVTMWLVTTSSPWFGPMAWAKFAEFDGMGDGIEFALDGQFNVVVMEADSYVEYHGTCADMDTMMGLAIRHNGVGVKTVEPNIDMNTYLSNLAENAPYTPSHGDEDFQRCVSARSLSTAVFVLVIVFFALVAMGHLRYGTKSEPGAEMLRPWLCGLLILLITGHMIAVGTADHYMRTSTTVTGAYANADLESAMPWAPYTLLAVFAILPLGMDAMYAFMPE